MNGTIRPRKNDGENDIEKDSSLSHIDCLYDGEYYDDYDPLKSDILSRLRTNSQRREVDTDSEAVYDATEHLSREKNERPNDSDSGEVNNHACVVNENDGIVGTSSYSEEYGIQDYDMPAEGASENRGSGPKIQSDNRSRK